MTLPARNGDPKQVMVLLLSCCEMHFVFRTQLCHILSSFQTHRNSQVNVFCIKRMWRDRLDMRMGYSKTYPSSPSLWVSTEL